MSIESNAALKENSSLFASGPDTSANAAEQKENPPESAKENTRSNIAATLSCYVKNTLSRIKSWSWDAFFIGSLAIIGALIV